jgi:hypothetical protein
VTQAASAVSSRRESAPKASLVATAKKDEPALGGGAVEHVAAERHYGGKRAPIAGEVGFAEQRVGDDDLTWLDQAISADNDARSHSVTRIRRSIYRSGQREPGILSG